MRPERPRAVELESLGKAYRGSRRVLLLVLLALLAPASSMATPSEELDAWEIQDYADEIAVSPAEAEQRLVWQREASGLAERARDVLGDRFGGVWIDPEDGDRLKLGLASTEDRAQTEARDLIVSLGLVDAADIVSVRYPESVLRAAFEWLKVQMREVDIGAPGVLIVSLPTDENVVELSLPEDFSLSPVQQQLVSQASLRYGDALQLTSHAGTPRNRACGSIQRPGFEPFLVCDPPLRGGIKVVPPNQPGCTGGFMARGVPSPHYLYQFSSGHCWPFSPDNWFTRILDTNFDTNRRDLGPAPNARDDIWGDVAIIRVVNNSYWNARSWVFVTQSEDTTSNHVYRIRNDAEAVQWQRVCTTGSSWTESDCGRITDADISYSGNNGLQQATYCGEGGDSGAPVYAGNVAYGLQDSGSASCVSYHMKIRNAEGLMNVYVTHADD